LGSRGLQMSSWFKRAFAFLFEVDKKERLKLLFLTASFFFVIGGYTIIKELKDSIFLTVVGDDYLPWAKIVSMVALVPAILFYSFLVDRMRRYQLLYFYSVVYGVVGLIFAYFLGHPVIGIANTDASPMRLFGWLFYFFVEGYSPFVLSVFWAFANSITSPEAAKKNYGLMVSGSKLGGMATSALAWNLFDCSTKVSFISLSSVAKHQLLLAVSAFILLFIPVLIFLLMKKVPGRYMHGYEAVYKIEKEKEIPEKKESLFTGLLMIIKQPYVLGIFSMIFFYEVVHVVISYQRLLLARGASNDISELSCILFKQIFMVHFFGFLLSFFATNALLRKFGERKCLIMVPSIIAVLLFVFTFYGSLNMSIAVFILLRTINYGLSYPLRESLYIPTIKDIKFKSKSWIDSFGQKFAKGFGSSYNIIAKMTLGNFGVSIFIFLQSSFFMVIIGLWIMASYLLGKRYEKSIKNNEVIGFE